MLYDVLSFLSQIYCEGPILEAVQNAKLYKDSKYFVDMPLKQDPVTVIQNFYELGDLAKDPSILQQFVNEHFDEPGKELIEVYPVDWVPFPNSFLQVEDYRLRRWTLHLHRIWRDLCRKVKDDVRIHQERYSLLYVPNPFIIPGGRFLEFYYWDSFWIIKGLIFSEMYETAKNVINNLLYMVDQHGFVPNGGRIYYLVRSQPPLLTQMVYDYFIATGDLNYVVKVLPLLEKEFKFWLDNRAQNVEDPYSSEKIHQVFQYRSTMKYPRPESYREDMELVKELKTDAEREEVWSNIASAAEAGWDFSTRWFAQKGPQMHDIKSIRTLSIVPIDLNAFMCINMRTLAAFYEIIGNFDKMLEYHARYENMKKAIKSLHWNETDGIWYDYDLELKAHLNVYYVSNALPLYVKCFDDDDDKLPHLVYDYLKKQGILNFTKGIPTSLVMGSLQQWDKENAWPPMVHMVIEGFRTSGDPLLMNVAEQMATQWLIVNYKLYKTTYAMYEKYNVSKGYEELTAGGGGEYEVQKGFGWTNGVILDLLDKYGSKISVSSSVISTCYIPLIIIIQFVFHFLTYIY